MSLILPKFVEWYTVDSVEFASHGYWISEVSKGHAGRKGKDIDIPSIHGSAWREKRFESRTESWTIVITDVNPTTGVTASTDASRRAQFNENYDTVMSILNKNASQLQIKHNRINPDNSSLIEVRVAYGEIVSSYDIDEHKDLLYAQFNVTIEFADPRWYDLLDYSPKLKGTISTATSSASISNTAAAVGTAPVTYMNITFAPTGANTLVNPRLTNSTYASTSIIGYNGTIESGASVIIDTENLTLRLWPEIYFDEPYINVISSLYRSGTRQDWMVLFPTTNTLTFSVDGTSSRGVCEITHKRAFI
jgi:Tfp pilus assembly protein FimT